MRPATTFALLRHGKTVWNREKRVQGLGDSPLTKEGKRQIEYWSTFLATMDFNRIIASDLGRVRQTVDILNQRLDLPVYFEPALREQSWGEWEGMTVADVQENFSTRLEQEVERGWNFTAPGGESRAAVRDRATQALETCHNRFRGERILVVCHLGVIKCLLYALAGRSFLPHEPKLIEGNRLHEITFDSNGMHIGRLNIGNSLQQEGAA